MGGYASLAIFRIIRAFLKFSAQNHRQSIIFSAAIASECELHMTAALIVNRIPFPIRLARWRPSAPADMFAVPRSPTSNH
jgi:hypothetical protein